MFDTLILLFAVFFETQWLSSIILKIIKLKIIFFNFFTKTLK
jgi:hypothetical protein